MTMSATLAPPCSAHLQNRGSWAWPHHENSALMRTHRCRLVVSWSHPRGNRRPLPPPNHLRNEKKRLQGAPSIKIWTRSHPLLDCLEKVRTLVFFFFFFFCSPLTLYYIILYYTTLYYITLHYHHFFSRDEASECEAGTPHCHPWAPYVQRGRAGVHPVLPGGQSASACSRQPLHLWSSGNRQDSLPQLCAAGDEGEREGVCSLSCLVLWDTCWRLSVTAVRFEFEQHPTGFISRVWGS